MSGEKSVSGLGLQSCQQEGLSRFTDVKCKSDREKVAASEKKVQRKSRERRARERKTSKQTAGKGKASKFRDVKGKLDQEKVGIRQGWHEEEMSRRKESNR